MKIVDAISNLERDTIIRHLAAHGKWRAVRGGATIDLACFAPGGDIQYAVTLDRHVIVNARAKTVQAAVLEVNDLIRTRRQDPMAGRAPDPHRTGMLQLVRHKHRAQPSELLPYEDVS